MKQYDYLIVGPALFGTVFAYKAKHAGKKVLVLENRDQQYGPQTFHTRNKRVWNFVNYFVPLNPAAADNNQSIPTDGYTKMIDRLLEGTERRANTDYFSDRLDLEALTREIVYTGKLDEFYNYQYGKLEYPVNDTQNSAISARYRRIAARERNVIFGGSLAEYKDYAMDEEIKQALSLWE
jgi:UDP-galactopyranose mutase